MISQPEAAIPSYYSVVLVDLGSWSCAVSVIPYFAVQERFYMFSTSILVPSF